MLRTALFCAIMKRVVVIPYQRFGTTYGPETSVRNYHYSLRNGPKEHTSHLLRGGSLKSRILPLFTTLFFRDTDSAKLNVEIRALRGGSYGRCGRFGEDQILSSPERSHYTIHTSDIPPLAAHSGSHLGTPMHSINEISH